MQPAVKWLIVACLLSPLMASAVQPVGAVTLLEGNASLLRGPARYALSEGVGLEQGDILELDDKALGQIEFADGTIIDLGPQSRFLVLSYPARRADASAHRGDASARREVFLLRGSMKLSIPTQGTRTLTRFTSPLFEFNATDATAVVQMSRAEAALFMERGEARVAQVSPAGKPGEATRLATLQFFTCKLDQKGVVSARPSPAFLDTIPRSFMDTLPSRLARFKDRDVAPMRSGDYSYAEVKDWLSSTASVRAVLVSHWQSKLSDPAFRSAIAANLKDHPEWDRVLNPTKYEHAPASKPSESADQQGR